MTIRAGFFRIGQSTIRREYGKKVYLDPIIDNNELYGPYWEMIWTCSYALIYDESLTDRLATTWRRNKIPQLDDC